MVHYKSEFLNVITKRGFLHQCTDVDELDKRASSEIIPAYIGFDCTAPSLHIGSLLPVMLLRWLQKTGHKPIVLMGGGTTKVGDPSGKDESRLLLTAEQIYSNMGAIKSFFSKYLDFGDGPTDAIMINNADWLDEINYIDFLRAYGAHFTINRMLSFDSVKLRLDRQQPLTFLEFNYMILQAYDFLELSRRYNCLMQMGGSDQWGNIINGVELSRRVDDTQLFGLTTPLLTTSSGAKMGKTATGAIWLDSKQFSEYEFWQYWRNTEDADVGRFMRLFTELPLDEIKRYESLENAEINEAKKILANEVTQLCHGKKAAKEALTVAEETFEGTGLSFNLPTVEVPRSKIEDGVTAFDLFCQVGLVKSKGEGRRLIKGKGARLNDLMIGNETQIITLKSANEEGIIKLSAGKKRHVIVKVVD